MVRSEYAPVCAAYERPKLVHLVDRTRKNAKRILEASPTKNGTTPIASTSAKLCGVTIMSCDTPPTYIVATPSVSPAIMRSVPRSRPQTKPATNEAAGAASR